MSKIKITTRTEAWVVEGDAVFCADAFVTVCNKGAFVAMLPAIDVVSAVVVKS